MIILLFKPYRVKVAIYRGGGSKNWPRGLRMHCSFYSKSKSILGYAMPSFVILLLEYLNSLEWYDKIILDSTLEFLKYVFHLWCIVLCLNRVIW